MEHRFRKYSSDSLGSDGVFIEDSYYQGVLRVMDHRKGTVWPHIYRDHRSILLSLLAISSCISQYLHLCVETKPEVSV